MSTTPYLLGLDLGQAQDFTALAIIQRFPESEPAMYAVRHLRRWRLRTPYTEIVSDVGGLLHQPPLQGATAALLVDATGVGAAVLDLFRAATLGADQLIAVTITGGADAQQQERSAWRVPKRDLVGAVQVLLQNQRLKIAAALPEAETLLKELEAFRVRISPAGHDSYGAWRDGEHDDLVLAVALATWWGEHEGGGSGLVYIGGRIIDLDKGPLQVFDPFTETFRPLRPGER